MADDNTDLPAIPPIAEWDLDLEVNTQVYQLLKDSRQLLEVGFCHVPESCTCIREF